MSGGVISAPGLGCPFLGTKDALTCQNVVGRYVRDGCSPGVGSRGGAGYEGKHPIKQ